MKLPALREIIEDRKDKAIEELSSSYAKNSLPLEEYERLVEYINKIESERELIVVEKIVAEYKGSDVPDGESGDTDNSRRMKPREYDNEKDSYSQYGQLQNGGNLTVLSTRSFSGPLKSGAQYFSFLGAAQIKVRKADLCKQSTVLNVVSILGDNTIFVEGGIRVINNTIPIMGTTEISGKVSKQEMEDERELVISGTAILGSVSVRLLKE